MNRVLAVGIALMTAACSSGGSPEAADPVAATVADVRAPTTTGLLAPTTTGVLAPTTTGLSVEPTPLASTSTEAPVVTSAPSTFPATLTPIPTTPTSPSGGTIYGMPIEPGIDVGYAPEHHDYPATDIFAGDCGTPVVSPVNGTLLEVRRDDLWSEDTDNPATRGGKSVTVLGDDGVRYYLAHFEQIEDAIAPGDRVTIGDHLGRIGRTGRAGACHLHFALSPPCPGKEWSVRRGAIWPWPYLDEWRQGRQLSPADEIAQWSIDHPDAGAEAMADPHAADS